MSNEEDNHSVTIAYTTSDDRSTSGGGSNGYGYYAVLTAYDEEKLRSLRSKCWVQLNWLNVNAYGFRHVRQVVDNETTKRASKKTKDGIEFGRK